MMLIICLRYQEKEFYEQKPGGVYWRQFSAIFIQLLGEILRGEIIGSPAGEVNVNGYVLI